MLMYFNHIVYNLGVKGPIPVLKETCHRSGNEEGLDIEKGVGEGGAIPGAQ